MNLLNIELKTEDGDQISLPWVRCALTLVKACVEQSRVVLGNVYAATLSESLSRAQLDELTRSLKNPAVKYLSYSKLTGDQISYVSTKNVYFDDQQRVLMDAAAIEKLSKALADTREAYLNQSARLAALQGDQA